MRLHTNAAVGVSRCCVLVPPYHHDFGPRKLVASVRLVRAVLDPRHDAVRLHCDGPGDARPEGVRRSVPNYGVPGVHKHADEFNAVQVVISSFFGLVVILTEIPSSTSPHRSILCLLHSPFMPTTPFVLKK